jgi:hypothetical protein
MIIMHVHGTQVHTRYAYTYTCILHIFKDYFKKKIRFFILLQSTIFFQTKYIPHVIVRVYLGLPDRWCGHWPYFFPK